MELNTFPFKKLKPRPESGRDCVMCAEFVRQRNSAVSKAHRLVYHSTLGLGLIKKKKGNSAERPSRKTDMPPAFPVITLPEIQRYLAHKKQRHPRTLQ